MSGFLNKPKIVHGAFVEYGLTIPPALVSFQFNPVQLTRNRNLSFSVPGAADNMPMTKNNRETIQVQTDPKQKSLRNFHCQVTDLLEIRDKQQVALSEESISFDIRIDATDKLNEGDSITGQFGIAPQLATLELMVHPKDETLLGATLSSLLGSPGGFSFTKSENPPMILFVWGRKRVLPVNINSLNITETEFSTTLNPIRATVSVSLTVIEGANSIYKYTKAMQEAMSVLNLAHAGQLTQVVIPG